MDTVTLVAYFIAVAIPAFTVYLFMMLDIFDTGKASTILLCMGWGAIGAFLLAWTLNNAILDRGIPYETLTGGIAPPIEELLKLLILVYLVQHPGFRYIVDGAVYGIAVGIGFALSENLFVYLPDAGDAVLGTAISRTLSTSLMHATASGLVGISLGRVRRAPGGRRFLLLALGIGLAVALHTIYNNLARQLEGPALLIAAFGIGLGGGAVIAWQINQGLVDEKRRFAQSLGLNVGVSPGEREAVQRLGGAPIEQIFGELRVFFGDRQMVQIRRLLVIQANIGILKNNLNSPATDRLRAAWEEEIAAYRREVEQIRRELGAAVNLFMQSVFPSDDQSIQDAFNEEIARFDPTLVHTFDMFMRVSELARTFTPEQLAGVADVLSKIEIFRHVSLANLENLSRAVTVQAVEDGQPLFDQGDEGNAMYLVETGTIVLTIRDQQQRETLLRTLGPGSVVGELALLDGQPRSASARAQGAARVLVLSREVFMQFIQSRPQVVFAVLQYLAGKVRHTTEAVEASIDWMLRIGQGEYRAALPEGELSGVVDEPVSLEPGDQAERMPSQVGSLFSQVAAQVQQREARLRGARGDRP